MEIIQIVSLPMVAIGLKLELIFYTEVITALDDIRVTNRIKKFEIKDVKKRRRTSFALREEQVVKVQNQSCTRGPRIFLLSTAIIFFLFYTAMTVIQLRNLSIKAPRHFEHCLINVPSCDNWFYSNNNCLWIKYMRRFPAPMDATLFKFRSSSATVSIQMAGLTDIPYSLDKAFPKLRRLTIFQTNATKFDVDLNQWKDLIFFHFKGAPNLVMAHKSFFKNNLNVVSYALLPNLRLEDIYMPEARVLHLGYVGTSSLQNMYAPKATSLRLDGFGLQRLPKNIRNRRYVAILLAEPAPRMHT